METPKNKEIGRLRLPGLVLAGGIGLGITASVLLYSKPDGISIPILVALYGGVLLGLALLEGVEIVWSNLWLIGPILLLAVMSAVRAAPLLRFLNISGALGLLMLLSWGLASRPVARLNAGGYVTVGAESALYGGLIMPAALLIHSIRLTRGGDRAWQSPSRRVVTGMMIAAPFLVLFTALFASADQVFAGMVNKLLEALNVENIVGRSISIGWWGWLMGGGLAYALTRRKHIYAVKGLLSGPPKDDAEHTRNSDNLVEPLTDRIKGTLGMLETSVVLGSVNALFVLFVAIQFAALFGGEAFLQRQGLTYSEYAREGFFELLWVSIITLGLILGLDFLAKRGSQRERLIFLGGGGLMVVMTIAILASAYYRMQLYEMAYGFTIWRLYPHIFMIWLAVLFAYVLVFLALNKMQYIATGVLACALGFVITMNVLNPDALIVRQNVARYERGEELDVDYLGSLSVDAVPHLMPLLYEYDGAFIGEIGPWLHVHLNRVDARQEQAGWGSQHASWARATRALEANRALIESFELPEERGDAYSYP